MTWLQLTLDATNHNAEQLSDLLQAAGAVAVTLQDAGDEPLYEPTPGETPLWFHMRAVGLFTEDTDLDAVLDSLHEALGPKHLLEYYVTTLEDQDWTRAWMDHFRPMRFGHRLWVCPRGYTPPDPEAVNILLDPGLAFGTGTHPTTALCLEWLDSQTLDNQEVIDYGCGSGILAIAAARLGARRVWAVDYDLQALQATCDNAEENGMTARITTLGPPAVPSMQIDILVANILARPLIELAPKFAELLHPGGALALSGILTNQAQEVAVAYMPWFDLELPEEREGWVRLSGRRRSTHPLTPF